MIRISETGIPLGRLGLYVALGRLLRRVMADHDDKLVEEVEAYVGKGYAVLARGIIHQATGRKLVSFDGIQSATDDELRAAVALLAEQTKAPRIRPCPWYPDGWEAAQHMGLALSQRMKAGAK